MGICVEFNPDLALRNISAFHSGERKIEECIPDGLVAGNTYPFLKRGQRNYWLEGEIPLIETQGNQQLSSPIASIVIEYCTHMLIDGVTYTKGTYRVIEVFTDDSVHFNGFERIKKNT